MPAWNNGNVIPFAVNQAVVDSTTGDVHFFAWNVTVFPTAPTIGGSTAKTLVALNKLPIINTHLRLVIANPFRR
jgi:hypothetical protein